MIRVSTSAGESEHTAEEKLTIIRLMFTLNYSMFQLKKMSINKKIEQRTIHILAKENVNK